MFTISDRRVKAFSLQHVRSTGNNVLRLCKRQDWEVIYRTRRCLKIFTYRDHKHKLLIRLTVLRLSTWMLKLHYFSFHVSIRSDSRARGDIRSYPRALTALVMSSVRTQMTVKSFHDCLWPKPLSGLVLFRYGRKNLRLLNVINKNTLFRGRKRMLEISFL